MQMILSHPAPLNRLPSEQRGDAMKPESQTQQILILGGGYAGMIAAARIARGGVRRRP